MGIEDYEPVRDDNKDVHPGDISISPDPLRRDVQIINAIRQIMADLAGAFGDATISRGTWTPVLTFVTPGDLSVAYAANGQIGRYQKVGRRVTVEFLIVTSTFTHTTASGEMRITGLPFAAATITGFQWTGALEWGNNFNLPSTRQQLNCNMISAGNYIRPIASGDGLSRSAILPADIPTTSVVILLGSITYETAT